MQLMRANNKSVVVRSGMHPRHNAGLGRASPADNLTDQQHTLNCRHGRANSDTGQRKTYRSHAAVSATIKSDSPLSRRISARSTIAHLLLSILGLRLPVTHRRRARRGRGGVSRALRRLVVWLLLVVHALY